MRSVALLLSLSLAGCASHAPSRTEPVPEAAAGNVGSRATTVTQAPLRDVNLVRDGIPEVLQKALKAAYAAPADSSCAGLAAEVELLNATLGEDLDSGPSEKDEDVATEIMVGAVQSLIPYRSVLRRLSGAHSRERRALAAIAAGGIRRAYLKGMGEQQGCAAPAAPLRPQPETASALEPAGSESVEPRD